MTTQKEEIIANLYGLRAGLSVISQEHDKIKAAEDKADRDLNRISDKERPVEDKKRELDEKCKEADSNLIISKGDKRTSIIQFMVFTLVAIACSIVYFSLKKSYGVTNPAQYYCGAVFGIALLCILCVIGYLLEWYYSDDLFVLSAIGAIASGLATIGLFIGNSADKGTLYCGLIFGGVTFGGLGAVFSFLWLIENLVGIIKYRCKNSNLEKALQNTQQALDKNKDERIHIWDRKDREIAPHVCKVKDLHAVLRKGFCSILDERDWQNVDLVIYYLETRRADTIKEALQLVDREMQTQRIENLICSATESIINTLEAGFNSMQQSLAIVYNGLSQQLSGISSQLSNINSTIVSSQVMNQALMAKMNVTSNQMVSELQEIKNNAEYMRLKLT